MTSSQVFFYLDELFPQPDWLTLLLEYSNIVFCVLFGCEMTFKMCAYGLFGYISSGFNVFDGFIVILRLVDINIAVLLQAYYSCIIAL